MSISLPPGLGITPPSEADTPGRKKKNKTSSKSSNKSSKSPAPMSLTDRSHSASQRSGKPTHKRSKSTSYSPHPPSSSAALDSQSSSLLVSPHESQTYSPASVHQDVRRSRHRSKSFSTSPADGETTSPSAAASPRDHPDLLSTQSNSSSKLSKLKHRLKSPRRKSPRKETSSLALSSPMPNSASSSASSPASSASAAFASASGSSSSLLGKKKKSHKRKETASLTSPSSNPGSPSASDVRLRRSTVSSSTPSAEPQPLVHPFGLRNKSHSVQLPSGPRVQLRAPATLAARRPSSLSQKPVISAAIFEEDALSHSGSGATANKGDQNSGDKVLKHTISRRWERSLYGVDLKKLGFEGIEIEGMRLNQAKEIDQFLLRVITLMSDVVYGIPVKPRANKGQQLSEACFQATDAMCWMRHVLHHTSTEAKATLENLIRLNLITPLTTSRPSKDASTALFSFEYLRIQDACETFEQETGLRLEAMDNPVSSSLLTRSGLPLWEDDWAPFVDPLQGYAVRKQFIKGEVLLNDYADENPVLIFLSSGTVECSRSSFRHPASTLHTYLLEEGSVFGSHTTLNQRGSFALIREYAAKTDCVAVVSSAEALSRLFAEREDLARRFFFGVATKLANEVSETSTLAQLTGSGRSKKHDDHRVHELEGEKVEFSFRCSIKRLKMRVVGTAYVSASHFMFSARVLAGRATEAFRLADVTECTLTPPNQLIVQLANSKSPQPFFIETENPSELEQTFEQIKRRWNTERWRKYMSVLEKSKGAKRQEQLVAACALGQMVSRANLSTCITTSASKEAVLVLLELLRATKPPHQTSVALVLVQLVKNRTHSHFILQQGGSFFLRNLLELARKGHAEVHNEIDMHDIERHEVIGKGVAGVIYRVTWRGKEYAMKSFPQEALGYNPEEFRAEIAMMSVLYHKNIVSCVGACIDRHETLILLELFRRGSLKSVIMNKEERLDPPLVVNMALQIAQGMHYLHSCGVIHRDVKSANVLVADDYRVAVADFGISRVQAHHMTQAMGSGYYMAPEVLNSEVYSEKADVYSFAYVLWELVVRDEPFKHVRQLRLMELVCDEHKRPRIPDKCPLGPLIKACWHRSPEKRPTSERVVSELTRICAQVQAVWDHVQSKRAAAEDSQAGSVAAPTTASSSVGQLSPASRSDLHARSASSSAASFSSPAAAAAIASSPTETIQSGSVPIAAELRRTVMSAALNPTAAGAGGSSSPTSLGVADHSDALSPGPSAQLLRLSMALPQLDVEASDGVDHPVSESGELLLTEEDWLLILGASQCVSYPANSVVVRAKEPSRRMYAIARGSCLVVSGSVQQASVVSSTKRKGNKTHKKTSTASKATSKALQKQLQHQGSGSSSGSSSGGGSGSLSDDQTSPRHMPRDGAEDADETLPADEGGLAEEDSDEAAATSESGETLVSSGSAVCVLKEGDTFGEEAFLRRDGSPNSVLTVGTTELYVIEGWLLNLLGVRNRGLSVRYHRFMAAVLAHRADRLRFDLLGHGGSATTAAMHLHHQQQQQQQQQQRCWSLRLGRVQLTWLESRP